MKKIIITILFFTQFLLFACKKDDGDNPSEVNNNSPKLTCSLTEFPTNKSFDYNETLNVNLKFAITPTLQVGSIIVWLNDEKFKELALNIRSISISHKALNSGKNALKITVSDNINEVSTTLDLYMRVKIGDSFGGGIVFKTDEAGYSGLITTPNDLQGGLLNRFQYTNVFQSYKIGATSLSDGKSNTNKLKDFDESAGRFCYYYEGGGFSDWYLPAYEELKTLREVGLLDNDPYWSSTELTGDEAKMSTGYIQLENRKKTEKFRIRAIRQF